jgi:hypothetical protein
MKTKFIITTLIFAFIISGVKLHAQHINKTKVLVLGTAHLSSINGVKETHLKRVLDSLTIYKFDAIALEQMPPELLLDIKSREDEAWQELYSNYRGSEAEVGFLWNQKTSILPHFYPILSLYSKSIARKISSKNSNYIEEEKYSLHGIIAGIGVIIPGKTTITFQGQIFEPIMRDVTLYGSYVGVPYSSTSSVNDLSYKGKIGFKMAKIGALITYEILNLGAAENKNSKSILASQANSLSFSLQYEF